jgi:hypothetical protein
LGVFSGNAASHQTVILTSKLLKSSHCARTLSPDCSQIFDSLIDEQQVALGGGLIGFAGGILEHQHDYASIGMKLSSGCCLSRRQRIGWCDVIPLDNQPGR